VSDFKTQDERAAERRAADNHAAHACAVMSRRAFAHSHDVLEARAIISEECSHDAEREAAYRWIMENAELRIMDAARFIENERARMAR
jgi:hypothetical protein